MNKNELIRRIWQVESYKENIPAPLSFYKVLYQDSSESELIQILEKCKKTKIAGLEFLLNNDRITYLRTSCKYLKIKNYTNMTLKELKEQRNKTVLERIDFIKSV